MHAAGTSRERPPALGARRRAPRLHETSVDLEIPFHDVDALGIVWHGRYYEYLELAMMMIERRCRHVAPLRYGERVRVSARSVR